MAMRITVVIPVYNEASCIRDCLQALTNQSRLPDQVIIVDNNCTDETIALSKQYAFVRTVKQKQQGICAATKKGFDVAVKDCDIIMRCDADSVPPTDWIKTVEHQLSTTDAIAVTGPGQFASLRGLRRWLADTFYMKMYFWSVGIALGQKPLFGSNFAITAATWSAISDTTHLDDQGLHDDIDISFHVSTLGKIMYIDSLKMPISHRPFSSLPSFVRRYPIGLRSIVIHWPEQAPWRTR